MRIFVAGSTGAIGRRLVPLLVEQGHDVVGLAHTPASQRQVEAMQATPVLADALDRDALTAAVLDSKPDVVIHELTALADFSGDFKKLDEGFALTNRFRTEVTDTLLAAAREAGAQRFIAQSYCGWPFARQGGPVKTEDDPLDPNPPASFRKTLEAIRYLEEAVRRTEELEALALRYGFLYGPDTAISIGGPIVESVRQRKLPIVGDGAGIWSFLHIQDVAQTTTVAVTRGEPGIYNIVDDEPAPVSDWLPALAEAVGAAPPRRVPAWLARFAIGEGGVSMMTKIRGASNAKAKRELGWQPLYPSWRRGFRDGLN